MTILVCLTKYEGALIVLMVIFWLSWHARSQDRRIPRKKIGAILVALMLSFLYAMIYGATVLEDPFALSKSQGSWWYWYEFTSRETPFWEQGISISLFDYFFIYHTPREIFQHVVLGLTRLFETDLFGLSYFWSVFMILGALLALVEDQGSYLSLSLALIIPFLVFFYFVGPEPRLFFGVFPIFSLLMSNSAYYLYHFVMPHFNQLDLIYRLFAMAIFCFVLLQYARVNIKPHASTIYYPVLFGLVLFVGFYIFYFRKKRMKG